MNREQVITEIKNKYINLYRYNGEDALLKFDALLENIARAEYDLSCMEKSVSATGGAFKTHPEHPEIVKPNPLNAEIIKTRASYANLLTVAERYMGGEPEEEDNELEEFE